MQYVVTKCMQFITSSMRWRFFPAALDCGCFLSLLLLAKHSECCDCVGSGAGMRFYSLYIRWRSMSTTNDESDVWFGFQCTFLLSTRRLQMPLERSDMWLSHMEQLLANIIQEAIASVRWNVIFAERYWSLEFVVAGYVLSIRKAMLDSTFNGILMVWVSRIWKKN